MDYKLADRALSSILELANHKINIGIKKLFRAFFPSYFFAYLAIFFSGGS